MGLRRAKSFGSSLLQPAASLWALFSFVLCRFILDYVYVMFDPSPSAAEKVMFRSKTKYCMTSGILRDDFTCRKMRALMTMVLIIIIIIIMTFVKLEFSPWQQMCSQQTVLNKNVLSCRLIASSEMSGVRRWTGRLFHTTGPLTEKLPSPRFVLVRGTCSWCRSTDRRQERPGWSDDLMLDTGQCDSFQWCTGGRAMMPLDAISTSRFHVFYVVV